MVMPARWLVVNMSLHNELGKIATELDGRFGVTGKIASSSAFMDTAQLNQHLGTKYLGTLEKLPLDRIRHELRLHDVDYFVVWQMDGDKEDWTKVGREITNGQISRLSVYRVE